MKHHDRHLALATLLAGAIAAGCNQDKLVGASGEIAVYPLDAEFPLTYMGFPTTVEITVENTGRAPVELRTRTDPPFSVTAPERLPGAGRVTLVTAFSPTAPGPATGTLSIDAGGKHFEVTLAARAEPRPVCVADACEVSRFDPGSGTCVDEQADDDTDCFTHCIPFGSGKCLAGVCRSAGDGCDDDDPCTLDLVASDCACIHEPYPDHVSESNPCQRETCRNKSWTLEKAANGTVCGEVNECSGQYCTDGVCGRSDAPKGTICEAGTPCQKPRRCALEGGSMRCTPPHPNPSTLLEPRWRKSPVNGRELHFEGVSDDQYLYWVECDDAGCGLRSVVPFVDKSGVGGFQPDPADFYYEATDRFSGLDRDLAPMFTGPVSRKGGLLLSRGRLYSTYRDGYLEAFDAEDNGKLVFSLELSSDGKPVGRGGTAINAHGEVVLLLADDSGAARTLMAVSPAGDTSWVRPRKGIVRGLVADEKGNVYFTEESVGEKPPRSTLVSLDGAGQERFTVNASPRAPLAAFDGRVLHGDGTLFDTSDGKTVGTLPLLVPDLALPPVLDTTSGWLAGYPMDDDGPNWTSYSLQQFIPFSAEATAVLPLSQRSMPWERSEPLLLAGGSVLLAESIDASSSPTSPRLTEWTHPPDSDEEWSCLLAPGSYSGPATVNSSLWIAYDSHGNAVSAFLIGVAGQNQRRLASDGWLGGGGEPGRGNRPRR